MSACYSCRTELPATARFCLSCGAPQDQNLKSKITAAQKEIERERKFVCVLFGDLSGFTALSEKLDPEAVTDLVGAAFERLGAVVVKHDGYIDKFIGDCIMALFGAPFAHEDDPQRAVSCAIAMQAELEKFNQERKLNLKMRIGINSGIVVAGGIGAEGKFEYTVMGDAVNLAERVQSAAKPGEILITQNVSRLAERAFDLKELPAITAKGKSAPIPVFSVQSARSVEIPRETIHQGYSKLAGRGLELQVLETALDDLQDSKGQILILHGEAGVGKSRLIHEAKKKALASDYLWIDAPCNGITKETPFATFLRIARQINQTFSAEIHLDDEEKALLSEILSSENIPIQGNQALERKKIYFELFRKIVFNGLANRKAVITIEDMHWMDQSSKELLAEIEAECKNSSLLFLAASREEQGNFHSITLKPLSHEDCRAIVKSLLKFDELPESIWELVQSKADGNPLYVEELIKSLIDSKVIEFQGGQWTLIAQPNSEIVPQSLQALIASRIDRLPKSEKKILQLASVIGRSFSDKLLQQAGKFDDDLFEALRHLRRREMIFEYATDGEKITYIFKHGLTQDVAYESLLLKHRKEFHLSVAQCIESDKEIRDDKLELLAHHYLRADSRAKAIDYLSLCSMKSAAAYDNDRAIKFLKQAIQLMEEEFAKTALVDPRIFELLNRLEDIYEVQGQFEEAELVMLRQVFLSQSHELWNLLAQAYRRLGEVARARNNFELALDWHNKSLDLARQHKDVLNEIHALKAIGTTYFWRNELSNAIRSYESALQLLASHKNIRIEIELWNDLGVAHFELQDYSKAEYFLQRCETLSRDFEEMREARVSLLINLGLTMNFKGNRASAIELTREAAELAQKIGFRVLQVSALLNVGRLLAIDKRPSEAIVEFEKSIEIAKKIGSHADRLRGAAIMAWQLSLINKPAEAKELLESTRREAIEKKIWSEFWTSSEILADLFMSQGNLDEALKLLEVTQMRLENHGTPEMVEKCRQAREKINSMNRVG